MTVQAVSLKVGACFRFKTAVRRITRIEKSEIHWEYADRKLRIPIVRDRSVQFDVITSSDSY